MPPRRGLLILLAIPSLLLTTDRIAHIEFFGYQGIDVPAVRQALPFREGDAFKPQMQEQARSTVRRIIGSDGTPPTCTRSMMRAGIAQLDPRQFAISASAGPAWD